MVFIKNIVIFIAGVIFTVIVIMAILVAVKPKVVVSEAKYDLSKSFVVKNISVNGKAYTLVIGSEGGSYSYRGGAKIVNDGRECLLVIDHLLFNDGQINSQFAYIFPKNNIC